MICDFSLAVHTLGRFGCVAIREVRVQSVGNPREICGG